jgi:hypothetical protein
MRLCRFYRETDSLLSALTDKMSEYPVTDIIIDPVGSDDLSAEARDRWESLINVTLNLRRLIVNINVDKFIYGNSFLYTYFPFTRFAVDPDNRSTRFPLATMVIKSVHPTDRAGSFTFDVDAIAPGETVAKRYQIEDRKSESRKGFKLIRFSPLRMTLRYGSASDTRVWSWTPPTQLRDAFLVGDPSVINDTELRILEAAYKDRKIKIHPERLWVSQAPGDVDLWPGWGTPPLFRVLEDVYYYKILRRANEALAQEHITPVRFLSPRSTGDVSPQRTVNLADWQNRLKAEIQRFRADPNHIVVSPMPVEVEQMGGNARVMMVASEMEAASRAIATGVGCPIEFLWGGLTWSGGNVALRVLENHFLNERREAERLLDFLEPKIAGYFSLQRVSLSLSSFKMADDAQHQANLINMMLQGFLSREDVLPDLGHDPEETMNRLEREHTRMNRITMQDNLAASHMNTVIRTLEAKAEILMQAELQLLNAQITAQTERERLRQLRAHINNLHAQGVTSATEFDQSAALLQRMDPNLANMILTNWSQTMPNVTKLLLDKLGRLPAEQQAAQAALQAAPDAQNVGAAAQPPPQGAQGPYAGGQPPEVATIEQPEPQPEQLPPRDGAGAQV